MKVEKLKKLQTGLYIIQWKKNEGGGKSLAAVGVDRTGKHWFAPTNWSSGSTLLEEHCYKIKRMRLVMDRDYLLEREKEECQHTSTTPMNDQLFVCDNCNKIGPIV